MDEETGEFWIWLSFVPEHRLVVASHVGRHEQADAHGVVEKICKRLARPFPLFISDGLDVYIEALIGAFHQVRDRPRSGRPGRPLGPKVIPDPELRYVQLVKVREKGRVVGTHKRVIFGDEGSFDMEGVSTSLIERENLSFRQDNRRLSRKTIAFSKCFNMLDHQVSFFRVYSNFVKTHCYVNGSTRKWWARFAGSGAIVHSLCQLALPIMFGRSENY